MYDDIEHKVQKRIKARKGFMVHFGIYCAFVAFFFLINVFTTGFGNWWFHWPALGWGVGVASHYIAVFGFPGTNQMVEKWELEETAREMKKWRSARNKSLPQPDQDGLELRELKRQKESLYDEEDLV